MAKLDVVGGGPAGLFCAISAAMSGHDVVVYEEHRQIGNPVNCTGLVSKTGLDELSEFIDYRKCVLSQISGARIFAGKEEIAIKCKSTAAYVIDRAHFDVLCAERAEKEGVKIIYGKRVSKSDIASKREIVGADGPNSFVADYFRFPRIRRFVNTYQQEVDFAPEKDRVYVYLSQKDFPGFFGWVVPACDGYSRIGVGVGLPNNSKKFFDRFISKLGVKDMKRRNTSSALIPLEVRKKTSGTFEGRNVMLVGDAAGQVKASTGGGIVFGCLCGKIAGRCVEKPKLYEAEWRKRYEADLAIHNIVRCFLNNIGDGALEMGFRIVKGLKTDRFLEKHGHMDMPTKMIEKEKLIDYIKMIAFG
ncbi:MAG: NAD(P)/FAD-dependent oxidoreductase [Candidatus Anstonellales archaeon]